MNNRQDRRTKQALVRAFNLRRDRILRKLDIGEVRQLLQDAGQGRAALYAKDVTCLAGAHKARLNIASMNPEEKLYSAVWLITNGYDLPDGFKLLDGKLYGATYNESK